jgi:ABC-type transport system involved in multi-copper enzyme maturation permease subunit
MIRTLAWKEYREQRGLWIAIAVMGAILSVAVSSFARGGISQVANDSFVASFVIGLFITLMVAQGIVCGVQLLAGEKETGTLAFLDALSVLRFPVWWTKVLVGLGFVLAQALVLFVIAHALNVGIRGHFVGFIVAGVFAYCWGLLGGALCDKVFAAIAAAIGLGIASYIAIPFVPIVGLIVFMVAPPIFVVLSARKFGTPDLQRGLYRGLLALRRPQEGPVGWMTLVWLAEKQGRWIFWPGLLVSFLAGFVSFLPPDLLWLSATCIIGLVCGGAVFGPEQAGEQDRFLGAQRLPPGQVWLVKTLFWLLGAVGMTCLFGLAMFWRLGNSDPHSEDPFLFRTFWRGNVALFLTLWVVHGFCVGQFCSLLSRKAVVVGFVGIAFCAFIICLWLPSLVFGGVQYWQIMGVPLFLLIAARMSMWLWYSGRSYTRRHFVGLVCLSLVCAFWLGGSFSYRVAEIPDVGEPFNLQTFEAKVEKAKQSPAGPLIYKGFSGMLTRIKKVDGDWGLFTKDLYLTEKDQDIAHGNTVPEDISAACGQVFYNERGWPTQDSELGPRLDELFAGDWFQDLRAAATMPLGLIRDELSFPVFFPVRALQLQARGDSVGALENLRICLALARQFQNCNPDIGFGRRTFNDALEMEWIALHGFDQWLSAVGPRSDVLRKALKTLIYHEKKLPDPVDNIMADYITVRHYLLSSIPPPGYQNLPALPGGPEAYFRCPWEEARRLRMLNILYLGQMGLAKLSPWEWVKMIDRGKFQDKSPDIEWQTKIRNSRANEWFPKRWENLTTNRVLMDQLRLPEWPHDFPRNLREIRVRQVWIGLMLYQAEEGHAPAKLEDLVPRFMPAVPLDPWLNQPFDYKVSQGEEIEERQFASGMPIKLKVDPGQGVLMTKDLHVYFSAYPIPVSPSHFPVPLWSKEKK